MRRRIAAPSRPRISHAAPGDHASSRTSNSDAFSLTSRASLCSSSEAAKAPDGRSTAGPRPDHPDPARERLVEQPAIHQEVKGMVRRLYLKAAQRVFPLMLARTQDRIEIGASVAAPLTTAPPLETRPRPGRIRSWSGPPGEDRLLSAALPDPNFCRYRVEPEVRLEANSSSKATEPSYFRNEPEKSLRDRFGVLPGDDGL